MIEILIDCYDAKVHGREAKVQVHTRRAENGMIFEVWDLDYKELIAKFRVTNFDLQEFLKIAKALLEMEAERK